MRRTVFCLTASVHEREFRFRVLPYGLVSAPGREIRLGPERMVAEIAKKIRVMLVDDHRTLREGLKVLLEAEGDIEIVFEAESGKDAVVAAVERKPDVVLMDVGLVGLDGIEATRRITAEAPGTHVCMLSASPELHVARAALEAGALGYMLKRATGQELRDGVRATAAGRSFFSDDVLRDVRERLRPKADTPPRRRSDAPSAADEPSAVLTDRELEVLQMIAVGHSNREIAEILKLSVKTVETHRMHLMEKLDIHDISGLTRYALRKGLITV
jgi:DNA-binding NarL/FixJ family response regulator